MSDPIISEEAKYVTGSQAIKSPRWPFKRDYFYRLVREGKIKPIKPYPGARPVYSVKQIDDLFEQPSAN